MNYVQNPSYVANGNNEATDRNHQRIPQAQVYISYPARQPAASGSFYAYGVSYTNSLTMSEHPNEAEAPADEYLEHSPQLQTWADETSDTSLPVNERLIKSNWDYRGFEHCEVIYFIFTGLCSADTCLDLGLK